MKNLERNQSENALMNILTNFFLLKHDLDTQFKDQI